MYLKIPQLYSPSWEPSSRKCSRWFCYNKPILYQASPTKQLLYQNFLQVISVLVDDSVDLLIISALYLLFRYWAKQKQFKDFCNTLGPRFIIAGDYNAKHTDWQSRLTTPRRCELLKTMENHNLKHFSTEEPTYWPSETNTLPDVKRISVLQRVFAVKKIIFTYSSFDHSSVLITLTADTLNQETTKPKQYTCKLGWLWAPRQREINLERFPKTEEDIEAAVKFCNDKIQWPGWNATPEYTETLKPYDYSTLITQKLKKKKTP
jgi:hypothetical protein